MAAAKSGVTDLIFASGDDVQCGPYVERFRAANPCAASIIVSRVAEEDGCLAALDAGATDFCGCAIDLGSLRWIVDNALGRQNVAVAAA